MQSEDIDENTKAANAKALESEYANINSAMSLIVTYSDRVLNNQENEDLKSN